MKQASMAYVNKSKKMEKNEKNGAISQNFFPDI